MSCIPNIGRDQHRLAAGCPPLSWTEPERRESKAQRMRFLASSPIADMRAAAAGSPDTPLDVLQNLSKDDKSNVRAWVLRNPRTPRWLVESMTSDADPGNAAFARSLLLG